MGALAIVRDRDVHQDPIPYLGGVAIYAGLWAGYLVGSQLPFAAGHEVLLLDARNVLIVGAVMWGVGLIDDIFDTPALAKLGAQLVSAAFLTYFQVQIFQVPLFGGGQLALGTAESTILTSVLVVAAINAVNFIDGLDGLAAGVVAAGSAALLIYSLAGVDDARRAVPSALLAAALLGACAGFYYHNAWPARIFMGDAGSQLLGLVLIGSCLIASQTEAALFAGTGETDNSRVGILMWAALPIAVAGIPLLDFVTTVARRLKNGQSLWVPDKGHLHHVLLQYGHSHRTTSLLLTAWAAVVACGSAWIAVDPHAMRGMAVMSVALAIFAYLELARRRGSAAQSAGS